MGAPAHRSKASCKMKVELGIKVFLRHLERGIGHRAIPQLEFIVHKEGTFRRLEAVNAVFRRFTLKIRSIGIPLHGQCVHVRVIDDANGRIGSGRFFHGGDFTVQKDEREVVLQKAF